MQRRLAPWLAQRPALSLFLDYDGTLTPIVPRPADALLSDVARQALLRASRTPTLDVTIVSGRALADVTQLVGIPGLTYVGNHGYEIEGPGLSYRHEDGVRHLASISAAADELAALGIEGALVERKGPTLSYHVRGVPASARPKAARLAEKLLRHRHLRVTAGKEVVEGRPPLEWDKGRAVLHVLVQRHGATWPLRVRALYIGDDTTDEDAFNSLHGIGRSICVAAAPPSGGSAADFRLPDTDAVVQVLRWLASGAFTSATA